MSVLWTLYFYIQQISIAEYIFINTHFKNILLNNNLWLLAKIGFNYKIIQIFQYKYA